MNNKSVSLIIPVFNEEDSIVELINEILLVFKNNQIYDYEIIIINDGSIDKTWINISELCKKNSLIKAFNLRKNFGKSIAMNIGFFIASKNYVITLDGDLQDNPNDIPRFISELKKFDFVSGWKKKRYDSLSKIIQSRIFNFFTRVVTGVKLNDFNCGFKGYKNKVVKELNIYGGLHRYIAVIVSRKKYSISEIAVNHRKRKFGKSKYGYGFTRIFRGLVDLFYLSVSTEYYKRPPINKIIAKKYIKNVSSNFKLN